MTLMNTDGLLHCDHAIDQGWRQFSYEFSDIKTVPKKAELIDIISMKIPPFIDGLRAVVLEQLINSWIQDNIIINRWIR